MKTIILAIAILLFSPVSFGEGQNLKNFNYKYEPYCFPFEEYNNEYPDNYFNSLSEMLEFMDVPHLERAFKKLIISESNYKANAVNRFTKAKGYIQIMDNQRRKLKIPEGWATLKDYQYDIIAIYYGCTFTVHKGKLIIKAPKRGQNRLSSIRSYKELQLLNFYPYALNKPNTFVLGSERDKKSKFWRKDTNWKHLVARQNKVFDKNEDGVITKAEFLSH